MQSLRKPLLLTTAALVAAGCIVFGALLVGLNSDLGRAWLLARINATIPGSVSIGDHRLSLLKMGLDLDRVVLHDAQGLALAGIEHLYAKIDWAALFQHEIRFEKIIVETPWADLTVDERGAIDLTTALAAPSAESPPPSPKTSGARRSVNLVVEKLQLVSGRLSLQSMGNPVVLNAKGIGLDARGDLMNRSAHLDLVLADIRLQDPGIHLQPARLRLKASLNKNALQVAALDVASGRTRLHLAASVADLDSTATVDGLATLESHLAELESIFDRGGNFNGPVTAELSLTGKLADPEADLSLEIGKGAIAGHSLDRGQMAIGLRDRRLSIETAALHLAGGRVDLNGAVDLRGIFPQGFLAPPQALDRIGYTLNLVPDIPDLRPWLEHHANLEGGLSGRIVLTGEGITPTGVSARLELTGSGQQLIAPGMQRPLDAALDLAASWEGSVLSITRINARTNEVHLSGSGQFAWGRQEMEGRFTLDAQELSEALTLVGLPPIRGTCEAAVTVGGKRDAMRADLSIRGRAIGVDSVKIGAIDSRMQWENGALSVNQLELKNKASSMTAAGRIQLAAPGSGRFLQGPTFAFTAASDHLDLSHFTDAAGGRFAFDAELTGSANQPAGRISLAGQQVALAGQPFERVAFDARLLNKRLWIDRFLAAVGPEEEVRGNGWMDRDRSLDLQLSSEGIALSRIEPLKDRIPGEGVLRFGATAKGPMDNPTIEGNLTVSDLVVNKEAMDDFNLTFSLQDMRAQAAGNLGFDVEAACDLGNGDFEGRLTFNRTETNAWFRAAGQPEVNGTVTGQVDARGNFRDAADVLAEMALSRLDLYYGDISLVRSDHIAARLADRTLSVPGFSMSLLSTGNLAIKGEARKDGELNIELAGRVPLAAAGLFVEDLDDAAGNIALRATLSGPGDNPQMHAQIDMEEIGLSIPGTMQQIHALNGRIHLTPDRLRIAGLNGSLDTGSFAVEGAIQLDRLTPSQVNLGIELKSLPLEIPDTLEVLLNGDIRLTGNRGAARASGGIVLLEGVYYKDAKINLVQMATTRQRPVAPPPRSLEVPYFDRVDLDIVLGHRQPFAVENNLADLEISPDLKIGGTLNRPIVSGRAQVNAGTITFQKKTFEVSKGVIDFVNPYRTEPEIDIESQTQIRSWKILLTVKGTPENLDVSLTSQPEETESNILSLILFGRTARELTAGEGGSQRTTSQIVTEMLADTFGDDIKNATGLDILEMETNGSSDSQDAGDVKVTMGKHLSDRMTVKYAIETKDGETIQRAITEYKLLEHILLSGFQENTGNYGSELVFRIEFR